MLRPLRGQGVEQRALAPLPPPGERVTPLPGGAAASAHPSATPWRSAGALHRGRAFPLPSGGGASAGRWPCGRRGGRGVGGAVGVLGRRAPGRPWARSRGRPATSPVPGPRPVLRPRLRPGPGAPRGARRRPGRPAGPRSVTSSARTPAPSQVRAGTPRRRRAGGRRPPWASGGPRTGRSAAPGRSSCRWRAWASWSAARRARAPPGSRSARAAVCARWRSRCPCRPPGRRADDQHGVAGQGVERPGVALQPGAGVLGAAQVGAEARHLQEAAHLARAQRDHAPGQVDLLEAELRALDGRRRQHPAGVSGPPARPSGGRRRRGASASPCLRLPPTGLPHGPPGHQEPVDEHGAPTRPTWSPPGRQKAPTAPTIAPPSQTSQTTGRPHTSAGPYPPRKARSCASRGPAKRPAPSHLACGAGSSQTRSGPSSRGTGCQRRSSGVHGLSPLTPEQAAGDVLDEADDGRPGEEDAGADPALLAPGHGGGAVGGLAVAVGQGADDAGEGAPAGHEGLGERGGVGDQLLRGHRSSLFLGADCGRGQRQRGAPQEAADVARRRRRRPGRWAAGGVPTGGPDAGPGAGPATAPAAAERGERGGHVQGGVTVARADPRPGQARPAAGAGARRRRG